MAEKLIVISGKQFSGKDTLAKILLEGLSGFRRIGIADAIKLEYGKTKNLTVEQIEEQKHLYREDLIALGNYGRSISDDYWLMKIISAEGKIIVPDLRVKKELELFKANGAISIRVESSAQKRALRGVLIKEDDPTETELDDIKDWDFVVQNDGTYQELKDNTAILLEHLNKVLQQNR